MAEAEYEPGDDQKVLDTVVAFDAYIDILNRAIAHHHPQMAEELSEDLAATAKRVKDLLPAELHRVEGKLNSWVESLKP